MAKKVCVWCGSEYEHTKSGASDKMKYCGKKCETDAKAKK